MDCSVSRNNAFVRIENRRYFLDILVDIDIPSISSIILEHDDAPDGSTTSDISGNGKISSFYDNRIFHIIRPGRYCFISRINHIFGAWRNSSFCHDLHILMDSIFYIGSGQGSYLIGIVSLKYIDRIAGIRHTENLYGLIHHSIGSCHCSTIRKSSTIGRSCI